MEESDLLKDFEGIKDYRAFLVDLNKGFKSTNVLYGEFKALEKFATSALSVSPKLHDLVSKQQSSVYSKLLKEVESLSDCLERGKVCFIKSDDLNKI